VNVVNSYNIESFNTFDKTLKGVYDNIVKENEANSGAALVLSNAISFTVFFSQAIFQDIEFYKFVNKNLVSILPAEKRVPNLGFTIFKCGKAMNSKVKFEKFMLIINNSSKMPGEELENLVVKIYASIRKILTAGKAGVFYIKILLNKLFFYILGSRYENE
jgi:enolase